MKKPNIILITLDALRADHLGVYGYKKNISPFIDSLAKKGVFFKYAYPVGTATPQSFSGIMSSTYPLDFGGYSREGLAKRTLIPEVLQKAGYRTMAFHSNAYLSSYFGYERGWDKFRYLNYFEESTARPSMKGNTWQFKLAKSIAWRHKISEFSEFLGSLFGLLDAFISTFRKMYRDAANPIQAYYTAFEMNKAVKEELNEKPEQPLFLWVHYMDAHDPYGLALRRNHGALNKIKSYLADYIFTFFSEYPRINKLFNGLYRKMYDAGIKNIDSAIKELFDYLSDIGVLDGKSAVFITADHGEAFGEHNAFMHGASGFNENVRVPLIVVAPEKFCGKAGERDTPRSLIDLAPTIIDFAGVKSPENFRGKNIFGGGERDVVIELSKHNGDLSGIKLVGKAIVCSSYKFIETPIKKFLFSLEDEKEKSNIYENNKETASNFEKKLKNLKHYDIA